MEDDVRLLGLDFETTGFDTANDRIVEIGAALWDVEAKRPLVTIGIFLYDQSIEAALLPPVVEMMARVTGITPENLREFGTTPKLNYEWLEGFVAKHKVDYIVAHNGENFDKPFLHAELARSGVHGDVLRSIPWIDTRTDIPFLVEPDSRKLKHLAGDHGFINPFAHRAVFDVLTMMRVLTNYDINAVLEYQKIPFIVVRALVSFADKDLAKAQRYSWEKIGEETYPKMWVKKIKVDKLDAETAACKFPIARIK